MVYPVYSPVPHMQTGNQSDKRSVDPNHYTPPRKSFKKSRGIGLPMARSAADQQSIALPEGTRDRLLVAARRMLARRGYLESSVDDLAAAAGLTKGSIYSQFGSKRSVLVALIEGWCTDAQRLVCRPTQRPFRAAAEFVLDSAGWYPLIPEFWRQALDDREVRAGLASAYRRIEDGLAGTSRRWRYPADAAAAAGVTLRLHDGLVALSALDPGAPLPRRAEIEQALMAVRGEDARVGSSANSA